MASRLLVSFSNHIYPMPIQNISGVMTDISIAQFKASLTSAEAFIPALVTLTESERAGLQSIGAERFSFVSEALLGAKNNANVVPGFLNVTEWEKDLNYWKALDDVKIVLEKLLGKVSDTQRAVGSEAYRQGRKFYEAVGSALEDVPGIVPLHQTLAVLFEGQGGIGAPPTPPTP